MENPPDGKEKMNASEPTIVNDAVRGVRYSWKKALGAIEFPHR
jgi:hypothetical protein